MTTAVSVSALALLGFAFLNLWDAVLPHDAQTLATRAATVIESIGLLAVALVAVEMAQTVAEEEVVRRIHEAFSEGATTGDLIEAARLADGFGLGARVFDDPFHIVRDDGFAIGEYRSLAFGDAGGVILAVVFSEPVENVIRLISVRRATPAERKLYDDTPR